MILCSLPVLEQSALLTINPKINYLSYIEKQHPAFGIKNQIAARHVLSLHDHSFIGRIYALEIMDKKQLQWTTTIDCKKMKEGKYREVSLEMSGISPTTLLMFHGFGGVIAE